MRFVQTELAGAWLIELTPVYDDRGSFTRTFCEKEMAEHSLVSRFVQHSRSRSAQRGTLRGMHFQRPPHGEVKIVSCTRGAIVDVALDLRPDSPTRYKWVMFELTPENNRQLYIPEGFAHGFQTLTADAEVSYLISQFYSPSSAAGARHDDPAFAIEWPLEPVGLSEKDRAWPLIRQPQG